MRIINKLITLFLATYVLVSCSSIESKDKSQVFRSEDLDLPTRNLSSDKLRRDVELLIYALDKAYPPARRGLTEQYKKIRDQLVTLSKYIDVQLPSELCRKIDDILETFPDNHLRATIGNGISCSLKRVEEVGHVGSNLSSDKQVWSLHKIKIHGKNVPLIAINRCALKGDSQWNGFLEEVSRLKQQAPALIIDIRGNPGGDSSIGTEMAEILYGGPVPDMRKGFEVRSPEAIQMERNSFQSKASYQYLTKGEIPEFLKKRLDEIDANLLRAKSGQAPETKETTINGKPPFRPEIGFTKPIYVLQDKACLSSCEALLEDLENHPKVVTVGENTGGSIHFGNVRNLVLPATGIVVQIPTKSFEYPDHRFLEKIGYSPKVTIKSGENALEWVIKNLAF